MKLDLDNKETDTDFHNWEERNNSHSGMKNGFIVFVWQDLKSNPGPYV